jgi:predicted GNAT family N-acyltransferase
VRAARGDTAILLVDDHEENLLALEAILEPTGFRLVRATSGEARGKGVGRALLAACLEHVATEGGGEVWCNARAEALGFYAAAGFEVVGEEFEIPGIGPHRVMRRDIARAA